MFIIQSKLIGQEGRRKIVVSLAQHLPFAILSVEVRMFQRIANQKGLVDPEVTAIPILHLREHVFQKIKQLDQIKRYFG